MVRLASFVAILAFVLALVVPRTMSSFTDTTSADANVVTASPDWTPPSVDDVVAQKAEGGATGKLRPGGQYYLYANVSPTGAPPSGVAAVTAVPGPLAASNATMSKGDWTVNGTHYGYRSPILTVPATLSAGSQDLTVRATDNAGNAPGTATVPVSVETAALRATAVSITSAGYAGKPSTGDAILLTYNRAPEPATILAGWDGSATSVDLVVVDGGAYGVGSTNDLIGALDSTGNLLPLGYVATNGEFVASGRTVTFARSSMMLDGAAVTVTLGTPDLPGYLKTDIARNAPVWTPTSTVTDEYGLAASTAAVTGVAVKLF